MDITWNKIWGLGVIIVGIVWLFKRNIPVGIEGRSPSFYVKGKVAITMGVLAIVLGLTIAFDIPKKIEVDRCLDSGGMYDYDKGTCVNR